MAIYVALLRGINVGGKNIVKMAKLKSMFENLGLFNVETYIQSGNVLFVSTEEEAPLREKIELGIKDAFGIPASVILRTSAELEQIISNLPFTENEIADAESSSDAEILYVALLPEVPSTENIRRLDVYKSLSDEYRVSGREVYLLLHHSIRDSKLAGNLYKLEVPSTIRNWKTINKLAELAKNL